MKAAEEILSLLAKCGRIMKESKFTVYDLEAIENMLEIMLTATINVRNKIDK